MSKFFGNTHTILERDLSKRDVLHLLMLSGFSHAYFFMRCHYLCDHVPFFGIFAKVTHMTISREYEACQDAECMLRCSTSRLLKSRSNIVCVSPKNFDIYSLECKYMMYSV